MIIKDYNDGDDNDNNNDNTKWNMNNSSYRSTRHSIRHIDWEYWSHTLNAFAYFKRFLVC